MFCGVWSQSSHFSDQREQCTSCNINTTKWNERLNKNYMDVRVCAYKYEVQKEKMGILFSKKTPRTCSKCPNHALWFCIEIGALFCTQKNILPVLILKCLLAEALKLKFDPYNLKLEYAAYSGFIKKGWRKWNKHNNSTLDTWEHIEV